MKLGEVILSSGKEGGALELGRQTVSNLSPVWPRAGYLTSLSLNFLHLETGDDNVWIKDCGRILPVSPSSRCKTNTGFLPLFLLHIQQI